LESNALGDDTVMGISEHGNEILGFLKYRIILDYLNDLHLLLKNSALPR
jgi:hypothetical protein